MEEKMSQKVFFTAVVILYVILGVGNLLAPQEFISGFGVSLTPAGLLMARVVATAAIAFAIIYWVCRDAPPSRLLSAVLYGSLTEKVIQVVLVAYAVNAGVFNSMGWAMAILQALLAVGFAYFAFGKR
jgi:hypothetical protein